MGKKKLVSVIIVTMNRKQELSACLGSVLNSIYKPIEVIVIDNASVPSVSTWLPKLFSGVKLITNKKNLGAAGGRNLGIKHAKGDYLLFMDDDAEADPKMLAELVKVLENTHGAGMAQPKIYFKEERNLLQGVGYGINLTTGRIEAFGVREVDKGQYDDLEEVPMTGGICLVKREVFEKVGDYDEIYFIPYEDSDFSLRARRAGFKICFAPKAKSWHQGSKNTFIHPWLEWIGITSPQRSFRVSRNKIIFMRKHARPENLLVFLIFLLPFYAILHSVVILACRRVDILINYWKGIFSGLTVRVKRNGWFLQAN